MGWQHTTVQTRDPAVLTRYNRFGAALLYECDFALLVYTSCKLTSCCIYTSKIYTYNYHVIRNRSTAVVSLHLSTAVRFSRLSLARRATNPVMRQAQDISMATRDTGLHLLLFTSTYSLYNNVFDLLLLYAVFNGHRVFLRSVSRLSCIIWYMCSILFYTSSALPSYNVLYYTCENVEFINGIFSMTCLLCLGH